MIVRKYLSGAKHSRVSIDMGKVYQQLDAGMTVQAVADKLGVHRSTLYRHHKKYQILAQLMEEEKEKKQLDEMELPPIPDKL